MQTARVVGHATSTVKHQSLEGSKLMLIQPLMADAQSPDGDPLLAVDGVNAGIGEIVFITSDGRGARELLNSDVTPVRWSIIGIVDQTY